MPRLSVWMIRAALAYLAVGFLLGALLLWNKGRPLTPALWRWLPVHVEVVLFGWVAQLALGDAFWILPRFWKEPRRGTVTGAYLALALLNFGIWLVTAGTVFHLSPWALVAGRLLEVAAAVAFAHAVWPRVVGRDG